jgi:hypothetical protein
VSKDYLRGLELAQATDSTVLAILERPVAGGGQDARYASPHPPLAFSLCRKLAQIFRRAPLDGSMSPGNSRRSN